MYLRPVWVLGEGTSTFPRYLAVAAAVGNRAVLGCDITDATNALTSNTPTRLQASQNRTNPCNTASPPVTPGSSTPTTSTTTTTTTPSVGPTVSVPPNASVADLLAAAQREFNLANQAYANGDLGGYQDHNKRAAAFVQQAVTKGGSSVTTTIAPKATSTTAAP
jgi:uncharacterized membrane protein (UPF0182 family)